MKPQTKPRKRLFALAAATLFTLSAAPVLNVAAAQADNTETEAVVTLTAGELELVSAPDLTFTTTQIAAGDLDIPLSADGVIEVSDMRGSGTGWSLSAALSAFEDTANNADSLPGAYITITASAVTGDDPANPAQADPGLVLNTGGSAVKVLYAAADKGMGEWTDTWAAAQTELTIPNAELAAADTHTATISWVLYDTPNLA